MQDIYLLHFDGKNLEIIKMKNKQIFSFIIAFCIAWPMFSQSWESIKRDASYLHGEGWAVTVEDAKKHALNDIISKISVHVTSEMKLETTQHTTNDEKKYSRTFDSYINSYTQGTLKNTNSIILENEPDAHVGVWIKVSEIQKIFEDRKYKIKDYVSSAVKAEKQGKIDQALKDYYWALCLTKSLQYPEEMKYLTEGGENVLLLTWIPRQINDIFSQIKTSISKRNGDEMELYITYKEKPVSSIDYTYFDGRDWGSIYSAKDGVGILELAPGNNTDNVKLKFEYEYGGEAQIDADVKNVMSAMGTIPMRNAYFNLKCDEQPQQVKQEVASPTNTFSETPAEVFSKPTMVENGDKYYAIVSKVIDAITAKNYDQVANLFTTDGLDVYHRLIKYGNAKIVGYSNIDIYKNNTEVVARGLQMSFSFKRGARKSFVEDVVFYMTESGLIDNITFGLGKTAEYDILHKGIWNEPARFALMSFLENYKTAYALKRLDYIRSIFDDDALIITGKVVKVPARRFGPEGHGVQLANEIIKYNRHSKDSYLRHLAQSFKSKEFINLRFANNDVRKLGKGGEMYAIQISQEYFSSNYGDKGYLFLMIDINNPDQPIIKVRTWQPEKDPNFGIYGPEHF